jgi:hypothetical protein
MALSDAKINEMMGRGISVPSIPNNTVGNLYQSIKNLGEKSGFELKHGRVVAVWVKQAVALVECASSNILKCPFVVHSSGKVTGAVEVYIPTIGDLVLVAKKEGAETGLIVCAFPSWSSTSMPSVTSSPGLSKEFAELSDAKTYGMDGGLFAGNTLGPIFGDALPGERYSLNENLVGTVHTKYYLKLQAGELCSITLQYLDGMLEAMLHNLRVFNSGFFLESICDFGRTNTELHLSGHLNDFAVKSESDRRKNSIIRMFSGWLSAGLRLSSQNSNGEQYPGSDVWFDELGTIAMRSNTSCFMQKVDGIYVPLRKFRADHPNIEEADHSIDEKVDREPFIWASNAGHPMAFGCQIRDYIAWMVGGKYQFVRYGPYTKDWAKLEPKNGSPVGLGDFQGTYGNTITLRSEGERKDDTNTATTGDAFCGVLPDGSVLLKDAWGSQVELRGGRVVISGANDVEITSGSNVVITGGKDVILKGAKHCEMMAVDGDIRIRSGSMTLLDSLGGMQFTAKQKDKDIDGEGSEYALPGIMMKADNIEMLGKKFEANMSRLFYIQGHDNDNPPFIALRGRNTLIWDKGTFFKNGEDKYTVLVSGNVLTTDLVYGDSYGVFLEGMLSNGLAAAIDGPIFTNGVVVRKSEGSPPEDPPIEKMESIDLPSMMESSYEEKLWEEDLRKPYEKEEYEDIKYKHRTTDQYRTTSAKWFEKFWQRQFKATLRPMKLDNDTDDDGEHSYPGKKHVDGSRKDLILYDEVNVTTDGSPKHPSEQQKAGGTFTSVPYANQLFKL